MPAGPACWPGSSEGMIYSSISGMSGNEAFSWINETVLMNIAIQIFKLIY
jgi:hypothetical protein